MEGVEKYAYFNEKLATSQKWSEIRPRLLVISNRKRHRPVGKDENHRLGMTLKAVMCCCG